MTIGQGIGTIMGVSTDVGIGAQTVFVVIDGAMTVLFTTVLLPACVGTLGTGIGFTAESSESVGAMRWLAETGAGAGAEALNWVGLPRMPAQALLVTSATNIRQHAIRNNDACMGAPFSGTCRSGSSSVVEAFASRRARAPNDIKDHDNRRIASRNSQIHQPPAKPANSCETRGDLPMLFIPGILRKSGERPIPRPISEKTIRESCGPDGIFLGRQAIGRNASKKPGGRVCRAACGR